MVHGREITTFNTYIIYRYIHYEWAMSNSYVSQYQRVIPRKCANEGHISVKASMPREEYEESIEIP